MDRKPFRPRKIVDYSKFVENDSDSDDFALPVSKKNKVKHVLVDLTTENNPSLAKSTSNDKLTNKKAVVRVEKTKTKDITPKIKDDDDEDFKTIGSDRDSQKRCSRNNLSTEDKTNKITVEDLFAKKEMIKSEIKENNEQLIRCEVGDNAVKSETNEKTDVKLKTDNSQLKLFENDKHSPELKKNVKSKRKEIIPRDLNPTSPVLIKDEEMKSSSKTIESTYLTITENVDQQKKSRKWKPPTSTTVANTETKLKSPLSSLNSGLRLGLSRNIRIKPLHSNVKIQS